MPYSYIPVHVPVFDLTYNVRGLGQAYSEADWQRERLRQTDRHDGGRATVKRDDTAGGE